MTPPRRPGWRRFRSISRRASSPPGSCPGQRSSQGLPVHDPQRLGDQLDLYAIRVLEVDRRRDAAVRAQIRDALGLEPRFDALEIGRVGGDGDVLDTANALHAW